MTTPLQTSEPVTSAITAFLVGIFAFLPNIIGAGATFVVGYIVVWAVVKALRIGLQKANVDRHLRRTEVGKYIERTGQTFSGMLVTGIKWFLLFIVVVYTIVVLNIPPLTSSMEGILAWIPNLVGAAIIVFVGALIASYAGKAIGDNLPRYGVGGGRMIGFAVKLLIYALVINFALIQLGFGQGVIYMTTTALSWGLAAALAIGLGVPIAYSLKGVMTSMASGATTIASTLREGQEISVEGIPNTGNGGKVTGTVRAVGMFNTVIERNGGTKGGYVILPNEMLMNRPIVVESGSIPRPWEHRMGQRVSDVNDRIEPVENNNNDAALHAREEGASVPH